MSATNPSRTVAISRRKDCVACGSSALTEVLSLPRFPLTGIFVKPGDAAYPDFDQALMHCASCGHAQLLNAVDPGYLYQDTYTHRGSLSPISVAGNDFFLNFLLDITEGRHFECAVEVGCNDLYLLRRLRDKTKRRFGVDPIWRGKSDAGGDDIGVVGKFIEEVDWRRDVPVRPDLVIAVHTLEHVTEPLQALRPIYEYALDGSIFALEVPGFDSLLRAYRFDQVFHQHLNYFSVASMRRMIEELGGEYLGHTFNYGYWMGTMLMAFRKGGKSAARAPGAVRAPDAAEISASYRLFQGQLGMLAEIMDDLSKRGVPIFGYGAAQMLPTLAYHLAFDLRNLRAILDDNPSKAGLTYPDVAVKIATTGNFPSLRESAVLITAIDSTRNILPRLKNLDPRYILHPFQVL